ncbi:hypothetical protein AX16_002200 [Volvariella volvacea WC 439]|nr:hypothetical protein AX16_002200 [Volvariella volvacea WC 439]
MEAPTILIEAPAEDFSRYYSGMDWEVPAGPADATAHNPLACDILDEGVLISNFESITYDDASHKHPSLSILTGASLTPYNHLAPPERHFYYSPISELSASPFSSPASTAGNSVGLLSPNSATGDVEGLMQDVEEDLYTLSLNPASPQPAEPFRSFTPSCLSPIGTQLADFPETSVEALPIFRSTQTSHQATCSPQDVWAENEIDTSLHSFCSFPEETGSSSFTVQGDATYRVQHAAPSIHSASSTPAVSPIYDTFPSSSPTVVEEMNQFITVSSISIKGSFEEPNSLSQASPAATISDITSSKARPIAVIAPRKYSQRGRIIGRLGNASALSTSTSTNLGHSASIEWHSVQNVANQAMAGTSKPRKARVASVKTIRASEDRRRKEATFMCTFGDCTQTFTARHNLHNHLNSHNDVKPFACSACGRRFGTKSVQQRHAKSMSCSGNASLSVRSHSGRRGRRYNPIK